MDLKIAQGLAACSAGAAAQPDADRVADGGTLGIGISGLKLRTAMAAAERQPEQADMAQRSGRAGRTAAAE